MGLLSSALGTTLLSSPSCRSSFELSDISDGALKINPLSYWQLASKENRINLYQLPKLPKRLEVKCILSAIDATFNDKVNSEIHTRLSAEMMIVVLNFTTVEIFLTSFVAEDWRDNDNGILLILFFTMVNKDGGEEWEAVRDKEGGRLKRA